MTVYNKDTQSLDIFNFNQFSSGGPSGSPHVVVHYSHPLCPSLFYPILIYWRIGYPHQLFAHNNSPISLMDKTGVHNAQCIIVHPIFYLPPYSIRALCRGPNLDRLLTIWRQWHINILSLLEQACCTTSTYEHTVCISIFCTMLLIVPKTYTLHFAMHLDSIHFWGIGHSLISIFASSSLHKLPWTRLLHYIIGNSLYYATICHYYCHWLHF